MKKLGIIFSIVAILVIAGCASSGGGSSSGGGEGDFYTVDLSTVKVHALLPGDILGEPTGGTTKNVTPLTKNYDDVFIIFPQFPVDVTKFSRVTIRAKYYNANGEEIPPGDGNAMVSIIEDVNVKDSKLIRGGAAEGVYPNIPFKQYNTMGFSGTAHTDKGARVRFSKAPGGVLFQNSNVGVKYIELTEFTFHNSVAPPAGTPNPTVSATPAATTDVAAAGAAAVTSFPADGKTRVAIYVTSTDRSLAARALVATGVFKTVGDGLAKAISETGKGEGVNLTDEITKAHGTTVSDTQAIIQQYGVQYLCVVTISNVKGKTFSLGVKLADANNPQVANANENLDMGNPVGMLQSLGTMSLKLTAGLALNAVLN
ncbi:MAG: hypothetical protein LBQ82_04215 [Treponema sp.]|nr:hypothetical protein [Treponema sp.]